MSKACNIVSDFAAGQAVEHLAGHGGSDRRGAGGAADHQVQIVDDQVLLIEHFPAGFDGHVDGVFALGGPVSFLDAGAAHDIVGSHAVRRDWPVRSC